MLNEDRVILMTRMAAYEKGEGKKNGAVGSYFRGDYIGLQVLKSALSATIAFVLCGGLYLLYNFDAIMDGIYEMDLLHAARMVAIIYLVVVGVYVLISYFIYSYKYGKARKKQRLYYNHLKQLSGMYQKEAKNK